jgi:hypothetical protein
VNWLPWIFAVLLLGVVTLPIVFFVHLITPSKTAGRLWRGFYTIDPAKITVQSADNVRMLSPEQIEALESRTDHS